MIEIENHLQKFVLPLTYDQLAFHDFGLSLGLLPPKLIKEAVQEDFIPSYR